MSNFFLLFWSRLLRRHQKASVCGKILKQSDNFRMKKIIIWSWCIFICELSFQSTRGIATWEMITYSANEIIFWSCINPFPHTTILQQTTLNVFCQNIENLHNWKDNLWLKVENIVAKGEIARFVQFLLLSLCFQKAVCCRGVRKRLYEGKG